jgi:hypothetical protein
MKVEMDNVLGHLLPPGEKLHDDHIRWELGFEY